MHSYQSILALLGQEESDRLEFKSISALDAAAGNEFSGKLDQLITEQIAPAVSAFLNASGGEIILGIKENKITKRAEIIEEGVPKERLDRDRLLKKIVGNISPNVSNYVNAVSVETPSDKLIFVITITSGMTAYQSARDKLYYIRRSGETSPMEDKDIRLRMLSPEKPQISAHFQIEYASINHGYIGSLEIYLHLKNSGVKTITRSLVKIQVNHGYDDRLLSSFLNTQHRTYIEKFDGDIDGKQGLMPEEEMNLRIFYISQLMTGSINTLSAQNLTISARVYIDDGLPAEIIEFDLIPYISRLNDQNWKVGAS